MKGAHDSMAISSLAQAQAQAARARATQQYQQAQTLTVTPGQLVVLLYDGVLRFARRARMALADHNFEAAHNALVRTQDIITELDATLNDDAGAISTNLHRIYAYCLQRLIEANVKKDADLVGEVITHFEALLASWREAVSEVDKAPKG
jgi:flagellar secretion chaperone FliS